MESLRSPWGLPPPAYNIKLSESRSRFASSLEIRTTCPTTAQQDLLPRRQRSPSLPPILKSEDGNNLVQCAAVEGKYRYEEAEGETSGYASEAAPQSSPELWRAQQNIKSGNLECQCDEGSGLRGHPMPAWQYERRNSEMNNKHRVRDRMQEQGDAEGDARPKWGDKGVAVGRLWEPHEGDQRLPQKICKGPPSWVERGLSSIDNTDSQLLLIEHMSSSSSLENYENKSGNNNMGERFTYLLGQNVPIESSIKAERESKRLKALELQAAIVRQLEERELRKKEEKIRRRKEEMEEEERFNKQKDLELKRLEEERKLAEEKQYREQRRAEALREALEKAEQQAKIEKENKKLKKLKDNFDSMSINSETLPPTSPKKCGSEQSTPYKESKLIQNIYIEQAFSPRKKVVADNEQQNVSTNIIMSNPQSARFTRSFESYSQDENKTVQQTQQNITPVPCAVTSDTHVSLVPMTIPHDVFTPMNIAHTGGMQMAFLMPQHIYQCMHPVNMQPLYPSEIYQLQQHRLSQPPHTDTDDSCSNRVLTPSKYRNPNSRDVSTQTDFESVIEPSTKKPCEYKTASNNKGVDTVDENTDQNTSNEKLNLILSKKEKRSTSEDKYKELENRPKWGVNKPPTQYKKQSEKDVFYTQKRKLRSRKRIQEKQYTSHSSDENRSPSPQESPKLQSICHQKLDRNGIQSNESYWRRSGNKPDKVLNVGNNIICIETSEITPLECDKSGVVRVCNRNSTAPANINQMFREVTPQSKKLTLSQKFMNDKYGNPKIWNNEDRKQNFKKEEPNSKFAQRKHFLDTINRAKKEQSKYYCEPDSNSSKPIILDQLKTLKDSLKKQQQIWGKYEPPRSQSPNNEQDLEIE